LSKVFIVFFLSTFAFVASAQTLNQLDARTGVAELVIASSDSRGVAEKVKKSLDSWGTPVTISYRSASSEIPVSPDEPTKKQVHLNGSPLIEYHCEKAYAEVVKSPPPVENAMMFIKEYIQVCLFPFQGGTKVYVIFTSAKRTNSLTGGLFSGITKAIRGSDEDFMSKEINKIITDIKGKIPSVLVARIDIPGTPIQEPDKAAAASILPNKPTNITPAAKTTTGTTGQTADKIEARKSLVAMGMVYHDKEQFFSAIKRKDDLAVKLFLDAGAIDLAERDPQGRTAVEIAKAVGANDILSMLEKTSLPQPVGQTQISLPPSQTPQASQVNSDIKSMAAEMEKRLPIEVVASIDEQINEMNLPPQQREHMRYQALISVGNQLGVMRGNKPFGN